ncbi:MAG: ATP-binding protein, partial [Bacteroidota bacterium]
MIEKIYIENYKIFESFTLECNDELNIIVGDNETGKSTILEAIGMAFTKRINGRQLEAELSPYFFNKNCVENYFKLAKTGKNPELPKVIIELYLSEDEKLAALRGTNNTQKENCIGVKLEIVFNEDYTAEYAELFEDINNMKVIPSEYYKVCWYSFANNPITGRILPIGISYIDATVIRLQSGT